MGRSLFKILCKFNLKRSTHHVLEPKIVLVYVDFHSYSRRSKLEEPQTGEETFTTAHVDAPLSESTETTKLALLSTPNVLPLIADELKKPVFLTSFAIAAGAAVNLIALDTTLANALTFDYRYRILKKYPYGRFTMRVRIVVSGSPYSTGSFVVSLRPIIRPLTSLDGGVNTACAIVLAAQAMEINHVWCFCRDSGTYDLVMPTISTTDWIPLTLPTLPPIAQLQAIVATHPNSTSTSETGGCSCQIYTMIENPEFLAYGPMTPQSEKGGRIANIVGTSVSKIGYYASDRASQAVTSALASLGLGKPVSQNEVSLMAPINPNSDGNFRGTVLSTHMVSEEPIPSEDHMLLSHHVDDKWNFVGTFSIVDGIAPSVLLNRNTMFTTSYDSYLGLAWHNRVQFLNRVFTACHYDFVTCRVTLDANAFQRGTLRITYIPSHWEGTGSSTVAYADDRSDYMTTTCTYPTCTQVELKVPWTSLDYWGSPILGTSGKDAGSGTFVIESINVPKTSGAPVTGWVEFKYDGMKWARPSTVGIYTKVQGNVVLSPQSGIDEVKSIRDIIKCYSTFLIPATLVDGSNFLGNYTFNNSIRYYNDGVDIPDGLAGTGGTSNRESCVTSYLAYFSHIFLMHRGSLRYRVIQHTLNGNVDIMSRPPMQVSVYRRSYTSSGNDQYIDWPTTLSVPTSMRFHQQIALSLNMQGNHLEFEVPLAMKGLWLPSKPPGKVLLRTVYGCSDLDRYYGDSISVLFQDLDPFNTRHTTFQQAAGDDFTFCGDTFTPIIVNRS